MPGLHQLHLVVRAVTALQAMRFQSNYRWNRWEMGALGGSEMTTVRIGAKAGRGPGRRKSERELCQRREL